MGLWQYWMCLDGGENVLTINCTGRKDADRYLAEAGLDPELFYFVDNEPAEPNAKPGIDWTILALRILKDEEVLARQQRDLDQARIDEWDRKNGGK